MLDYSGHFGPHSIWSFQLFFNYHASLLYICDISFILLVPLFTLWILTRICWLQQWCLIQIFKKNLWHLNESCSEDTFRMPKRHEAAWGCQYWLENSIFHVQCYLRRIGILLLIKSIFTTYLLQQTWWLLNTARFDFSLCTKKWSNITWTTFCNNKIPFLPY